ncbi:MAG: hypothetical protein NTW08_05510 [Gammaproteobacteria bacterium]|nr:hypothetical protein [Gammaproteobacteria bacterium]
MKIKAISTLTLAALAVSTQASAFDLTTLKTMHFNNPLPGHKVVQLGNYWSVQGGNAQDINILGLIGDRFFTVTNNQSNNALVGLGYYFDGQERTLLNTTMNMSYGINAFYMAKTGVAGTVMQEQLFTNLAYGYHVSHFPVYAAAKSTIQTQSSKYAVTVDAGIGPNFITTGGFQESPLDSNTIPDKIFAGHTTTTFSVTAGAGVKVNNVFGSAPLECGYRFYYLGQGNFYRLSNQVVNTLNTGDGYANAVLCSITV